MQAGLAQDRLDRRPRGRWTTNCWLETLTQITSGACAPNARRQAAIWRHDSRSTRRPIGTMRPGVLGEVDELDRDRRARATDGATARAPRIPRGVPCRARRSAGSARRTRSARSRCAGRFRAEAGAPRGLASPGRRARSGECASALRAVQRDGRVAQDVFGPLVAASCSPRSRSLADVNTCCPSTSNGFSSDSLQPLGDADGIAGVGDVVEQHRELVARRAAPA